MSTIQEALQDVGYKPPTRRQMRRHNINLFATEERPTIEKIIDRVIDPITRPLKVQVQRAGGYYRARFEGRQISCFGLTPEQATKNLKFFEVRQ